MSCFLFNWSSAWRLPELSLEIHSRIRSTFSRCSWSLSRCSWSFARCLSPLQRSQHGVWERNMRATHSCSFKMTLAFSLSIFWIRF